MTHLAEGSVAVVTGAAGGIGAAIVSALAAAGVGVAAWDLPGSDLSAAAAECEAAGVPFRAIEVDVTSREDTAEAARQASELGPVRYAVNVAGIDRLRPTVEMPPEEWRAIFAVNVDGIANSCIAEYELLRDRGGSIVNIASMSGLIINRDCAPHSAYSSSKAAVIHLTRALAIEWGGDGVRVNAISPGYTRTAMTDMNPEDQNALLRRQSPLNRMAEPAEIAAPVLFLLGDGASFITGANLPVDGAVSVW